MLREGLKIVQRHSYARREWILDCPSPPEGRHIADMRLGKSDLVAQAKRERRLRYWVQILETTPGIPSDFGSAGMSGQEYLKWLKGQLIEFTGSVLKIRGQHQQPAMPAVMKIIVDKLKK